VLMGSLISGLVGTALLLMRRPGNSQIG
jgi:hypothetical protein